jgi:hypothetical protein
MIRDIVGASGGFLWWGVTARRDGWMQPTPLGGEQDRAVFVAQNRPNSFPNLSVRRG